jgi:glycosyltransferase involved in cell wall biosynthesis
MTAVGFLCPDYGDHWLGGIRYLSNVFRALTRAHDCDVQPVLLAQPRTQIPAGLESASVVRSYAVLLRDVLEQHGVWRRLGAEVLLDALLVHHGIRVLWMPALARPMLLGERARTAVLAWIPDLQHRSLPAFFDSRERESRDEAISAALRQATRVILSSEAARQDLAKYFPGHDRKLRVIRFVDGSSPAARAPGRDALERRYGFSGPYLLLPNQYWVHKNHRAVIEALGLLERSGQRIQVVSTGSSEDYRNPDHYAGLMRRRAELKLESAYRVLGVVPFEDLAGLLKHAVAVVNPSLFEGWSTTVEEAKSLGKRVLLSDIPVHREQAPERALFFDPHAPEQIADVMWKAWISQDPDAERIAAAFAAEALPARILEFGRAYAAIVHEAARGGPES